MGILDLLLEEIGTSNLTQEVRQLCDKIFVEEKENMEHADFIIKGPNIFLCLEVPGRTAKDISFLTLEREFGEIYIAALWTWKKNIIESHTPEDIPYPKKMKTWTIDENKSTKILTQFAKIVKTLRGE